MIERGLGLAAVGTGVILAPATGSLSPLVPAAFLGNDGRPWWTRFLPIFFALQVSGPISVAYDICCMPWERLTTVLRSTLAILIIWPAVSLPLLAPLGLVALGLGGMVAALVEAVILSRATRRLTQAAFLQPILMPWVAASVAGAAGWFVSRAVSHGVLAAALGAALAMCIYAGPIVLLRRETLLTIVSLVSRAVSSRSAPRHVTTDTVNRRPPRSA